MSEARQVDLSWMPSASLEAWQCELDSLRQLRMMLGGLGLRHVMDAKGVLVDEALAADIATIQVALTQSIDRAAETVAAMRELLRVMKGQPPAEGAKETLH